MASRPIIVQAGLIAKSANHDATDRQFAPSWMVRWGQPKRHEQKMLAHLGSGVHVETWDDPSWERRIRSSNYLLERSPGVLHQAKAVMDGVEGETDSIRTNSRDGAPASLHKSGTLAISHAQPSWKQSR